ncbi:RNA polymerase sigma factor [Flammeovirga agarivorans]|uniref:Sigma-70 family RNA polymerase sigma factor n=1 Tax=Flammeovirga agarivorans TaxID=2726742 RepID=A0A7X8SJ43_9BACT|nr:sigma-70 family RNA polymerase sigma factor [Flammeovirga agarivorans]NLR91185.1 sigma-70 family RNA polymerase sigma factor [Flammeovirga agarivorans]
METNRKNKFISTINSHKKIIYKIVNSYCQDIEDRKDLEQEIIIQLWNAFDKYNPEYKYSTWMYRIALNVAISFYRKEKKWLANNDFSSVESIYNVVDENEDETELDNNIKLLQQFINDLDELNKALMLLYLEEKSYVEIAEILGISKTNVATKISRLKLKLKKEFQKNNR